MSANAATFQISLPRCSSSSSRGAGGGAPPSPPPPPPATAMVAAGWKGAEEVFSCVPVYRRCQWWCNFRSAFEATQEAEREASRGIIKGGGGSRHPPRINQSKPHGLCHGFRQHRKSDSVLQAAGQSSDQSPGQGASHHGGDGGLGLRRHPRNSSRRAIAGGGSGARLILASSDCAPV